jgi:hypothetical protein
MLGLWAAQRHDLPVGPTFRLMVERFERSQQADGWWSYAFVDEQSSRHPSMLCVGLLGLAIGRGLKLPTPGTPQPGATDLRILKGLAALSQDIGMAAAGMEWPSAPRGIYYLWSVERVAMLYDLPTIGDKDWYRWGAGILVAGQNPGGEWSDILVSGKEIGHHWGTVIATSFALLFLKHSHPMKDLTPKLPFKTKELNQGIARLLKGAPPLEPSTTTPRRGEKPDIE